MGAQELLISRYRTFWQRRRPKAGTCTRNRRSNAASAAGRPRTQAQARYSSAARSRLARRNGRTAPPGTLRRALAAARPPGRNGRARCPTGALTCASTAARHLRGEARAAWS